MTSRCDLEGVGVAVTRPGSPGRIGALLRAAGATVVHWPCIQFAAPVDPAPLADAIRRLDTFDWLILTSPRAARGWLDAHAAVLGRGSTGGSAGAPATMGAASVAAAGPATAAVLREAGWSVKRIPESYSAHGLLEAFETAGDAEAARVLWPCSDRAGDILSDGLRRLGAMVERVVAYRTVPRPPDVAHIREAAESGAVQVVTFTSPSTVEGFFAGTAGKETGFETVRNRLAAAAIGPTTATALADRGWPAEIADEATLDALVAAAARAAAARGGRGAPSAHAARPPRSRSGRQA